ncbi:MAG: tRNA preQ1(34) S-adenosylmethionine ribosyltransferase-isomerase QueA [Hyphomicrobiales bacterium]|nr:tRNA preQ1(34) S-adenosylmethionine ribosyltransferase-isomerase QueA [Hyphomicrobiales bacterium]
MRIEAFDFDLPEEAIALRPPHPRGSGRMLCVDPARQPPFTDARVADLPQFLRPGDILVLNDTKVIPARIETLRPARTADGQGAAISITLYENVDAKRWRAFARPAKRLRPGDDLRVGEGAIAVLEKLDDGSVMLGCDDWPTLLAAYGAPPLPPYIANRRETDAADTADYQTVFAAREGAVAAPTASLHLTEALLAEIAAWGVASVFVTLHVGAGTFLPVKDDIAAHKMHAEWGEITPEAAAAINAGRARGGRIVAAGTTALRLLESAADEEGEIRPFRGKTDIFITPGYRFRAVDMLMTNFHLPRSTLFMLVSAFCGLETMRAAYAHAIAAGYKFYSYGDSSLLHRASP